MSERFFGRRPEGEVQTIRCRTAIPPLARLISPRDGEVRVGWRGGQKGASKILHVLHGHVESIPGFFGSLPVQQERALSRNVSGPFQ